MNKIGIFRFLWKPLSGVDRANIVTFTGGMGAQIISAAIYFSLKNQGKDVFADMSYFDRSEHVALAGTPGDCSHWAWQLDQFGLNRSSFATCQQLDRLTTTVLDDGPEKLQLGLAALAVPSIQEIFKIEERLPDALPVSFASGYLCVHIRRGDYVNVASYLIADNDFIRQAVKFSGLVDSVVVLSDSPIGENVQQAMSIHFKNVICLDQADAFTAHRIMRKARIFICSNSQFSLIAAVLNKTALVLIPKQWFSGKDREIEQPLHSLCTFQLFD
jgi:hypothetical protein